MLTKEFVIEKMLNTYQTTGCNMLQHGQLVLNEFDNIIKDQSSLPDLVRDIYDKLSSKILSKEIIDDYQLYHDCGKPFCKNEIDGKIHYPDHATVSYNIWMQLNEPNKEIVADLMLHDMDFHIMRGDDLKNLCKSELAPTLYFTAWAELFANAKMFGGIESISFKIKKKKLINAGKLIKLYMDLS